MNNRQTNGKREAHQLERIKFHIDNNTPNGIRVKNAFENKFKEKIIKIKIIGGRSKHFDLMIYTDKGNKYKVEYKGSMRCYPIDPEEPPWVTGIQFLNGNPKSFQLCGIYAREWFKFVKHYIKINKFNMTSQIPSFEEYQTSIFKQAKNKNPYILEFQKKYKDHTGKNKIDVERKDFNKNFASTEINESILVNLKEEINKKYIEAMKEKEIWLQIHGDIDNIINVFWRKGMTEEELKSRTISDIFIETPTPDIKFRCVCGPDFSFIAHLRWGYYIGIGNLRIDFK